ESGLSMADRSRGAEAPTSRGDSTSTPNGVAPPSASGAPESERKPDDKRPRSSLTLSIGGAEAKRGARLPIGGHADAAGSGCAAVRIDLYLEPKGGGAARERLPLGVLVTDGDGRYEGRVVVPYTVPPGDYEVQATTPGNAVCGEGESP